MVKQFSDSDLERTALDYTLTKYLNPKARESVLTFFEVKHKILMDSKVPISREEVASVLEAFFGEGGHLVLDGFNKRLDELKAKK